MDIKKNDYELAFLVKEEASIPAVLSLLKGAGAEISFEGSFKKIALAYHIERASDAYFGCFHFSMEPEKLGALQETLRLSEHILRFLIVSPPFRRKEKRVFAPTTFEEKPRSPAPGHTPASIASSLPLTNEELEKKIDEILK